MNIIELYSLQLKTFTEQDASDYCLLNDINLDKIIQLELYNNKLTDISGLKIFKNLETLLLYKNKITDISVLKHLYNLKELVIGINPLKNISVIKDLKNIKYLSIDNLELESDQIKYVKSLNNVKTLHCGNAFKDMSVLKQLNKDIRII